MCLCFSLDPSFFNVTQCEHDLARRGVHVTYMTVIVEGAWLRYRAWARYA